MSYRQAARRWLERVQASARNNEPKITISEHSIDIQYVNPSDMDKRAWDSSQYHRGNIFIEGYANPVRIEKDDKEGINLIPSTKYQDFMKTKVIRDALHSKGRDTDMMIKIMIGIGILQLISIILVAMSMGG